MISVLIADAVKYYQVQLGDEIVIPTVYIIALSVSTLLHEFTHGPVRYVLVVLFSLSFAILCFTTTYEYTPMNYIVVCMVILGVISGMWTGLRRLLSDLRRNE